uniref:Uncharacterized protein n=1 Tax=Anopheles melas TaxID=34690 RepID=A0A182TKW6_9DIPT
MGHIKRSIVLVLFTQLLGYSEPKTIVFNSYSSEPAHQPESSRNVTSERQQIAGSAHRQEASESSGRGFSSSGGGGVPSFPFSIHPDFLSKPVQVARPSAGYKTPKYIVYPSYSQNTPNSVPYYNAPVGKINTIWLGEGGGLVTLPFPLVMGKMELFRIQLL